MTKTPGLKEPTGIYILAFLFILAPIGNILLSFAGSGISSWYEPSVFVAFLQTIPTWEWAWLGLLTLTGLLLFRPHKLSWSFAIFTLILILGLNAYRMFTVASSSIDAQYLKVFSILALFCTLGVLVIAFYFRFPYLDRRANWLKNIERFDLTTPAQVNGLSAETESLSLTGCRILLAQGSRFRENEAVELNLPEVHRGSVKCAVIGQEGRSLRVEFVNPPIEFNAHLRAWLKTKTGA